MDEEHQETETENTNTTENEPEDPEKKAYREPKKRMKRFYNSIRQQIEFYLGDVNLCRDRFFANLMQESPYIDIDVILRCNKIKKLTENPTDIVQALGKSSLISVTEDGKQIFRKIPIKPVTNADESTIYVEDLPLEVDHEWLKSVFSRYGEIAYISIPHYRTSRKLKGFAFIQFDTPESAEKALEAFRSANSCLFNTMEPKELLSIKTFEGEKDKVARPRGGFDADQLMSVDNPESDSRTEDEAPTSRKRKRKMNVESTEKSDKEKGVEKPQESDTRTEDEVPSSRKRKRKSNTESVETKTEQLPEKKETTESQTSSKKKKKNKTKPDAEPTASEDSEADKTEKEGDEKHPHRRRRKKAKKNEPVQTFGMQILSKNDWKKLRNKYLEEQRFRMTELKLQLQQARDKIEVEEEVEEEENIEEAPAPAPKEIKTAEIRVKFTPGVIVKLPLDQPIQNVKRFKNEVKRYADVEYIDADENSYFAYFRCTSNEIANQVISLNKWPNMSILKGDEEQAYWEKIKNDRKQKYDKKIRCLIRGKNKLMKKAEAVVSRNHVRFAD